MTSFSGAVMAAFLCAACGGSAGGDGSGGSAGQAGSAGSAGSGGSSGAGGSSGSAGSSGAGGSGGSLGDDVCAEQSLELTPDGHSIVLCMRAHPEAPFVRVPDDETGADGRIVYGGLAPSKHALSLRNEEIVLEPDDFDQLSGESTAFGSGTNVGDRYAYAIYRFELDAGDRLVGFEPVVLLDDRVLVSAHLAGRRFEGTISKKKSDTEYELEATLPIVLRFAEQAEAGAEPDSMHGYPIARLSATVENLNAPAALADGSCAPSLSSHGAASPLAASTSLALPFYRVPNMHGAFDDALVVEWPNGGSNMGGGLYVRPVTLLGAEPPEQTYDASPHGVPWGGPHLTISPSSESGAVCP